MDIPDTSGLDANPDLGLVAGLVRARRDDRGVVVRGQVGVGPVDLRLIETGPGHPGLEIVGHELARHAAEERQRSGVAGNSVRHRLGPGRFDVGVVRGIEHTDEDLRLTDPPVAPSITSSASPA